MWIVKSFLSHYFKSPEYRDRYKRIIGDEIARESCFESAEPIFKESIKEESPEEIAIIRDTNREFIEALEEKIKGDNELETVFLAILEGYSKSGKISEVTGIDVGRTYKLKEKLRHRYRENYLQSIQS
ncbi:MAG: hypothetical protein K8T10_14260 [Candidatus Eremiobacteraeota bacterium]|nr:hypothetical protein [Candidatus Eremiobacteraeota bacterium]